MVAQIVSLFQRPEPRVRDWTQQEIAEFYRVESALMRAGVPLDTDRGLSDEGDPWFVFCRADNGEVFIHFARIDGEYVVDGAAFERPARGRDFNRLVRDLIAQYPLAKVKQGASGNIFVHPAAVLIALVGAAFFHSNEAKAAETTEKPADPRRSLIVTTSNAPASVTTAPWSPDADAGVFSAIVLSAVLALREEGLLNAAGGAFAHEGWTPYELALDGVAAMAMQPLITVAGGAVAQVLMAFAPGSDAAPAPEGAPRAETGLGDADLDAAETPGLDLQQIWTAPAESDFADLSQIVARTLATAKMNPVAALDSVAALMGSGLGDVVSKALPQVDRLPTYVLELIARGEHIDSDDEILEETPPAETPPVIAPPVGANPPAPAEPGHEPPVVATPPPLPLPLPPAGGGVPAGDRTIAAILEHFMRHVADAGMMVQGTQLVVYDPDIFDPNTAIVDFDSVTFSFDDGSTLSLIGTAAEIHHILYG